MEQHRDYESRLQVLEREMVGIKTTIRTGLAVLLFMGGGYWWYANKSVDKLEQVVVSLNSVQTDVLLIKKDGERKDWERRLINAMIKKGPADISKSVGDD